MKLRDVLGLAVAAAAAVVPAPASGPMRAPPLQLLLTISQLGSLSWSCDSRGAGGTVRFRANPSSATEVVRIRSATTRRRATLQPGESVSVRVGRAQTARIEINQFTKARTLRATISVAFPGSRIHSYCFPYFPPTVALSLHY